MRPDIYELVTHAKEAGLNPMMNTNATLLSTEAVGKLKKAGISTISISLYGADAKSHNEFCCFEGGWERTMLGIRNVSAAGIPLQINTCIHHYNLDQLDAIIALAKDFGAVGIEIFNYVPVGRGKAPPDLTLSLEERKNLADKIIQHQLNDEKMVYRCVAIPQFWVEVEKTIANKTAMQRFIRTCCDAGLRYCCVFYEGTVYPCIVLQRRAGNVREQSFEEIWLRSEVFKILRDRDKLEGKCKHCVYRQLCGGARCMVFEKTGSLTKEDSACWFKKDELEKPIAVQQVK